MGHEPPFAPQKGWGHFRFGCHRDSGDLRHRGCQLCTQGKRRRDGGWRIMIDNGRCGSSRSVHTVMRNRSRQTRSASSATSRSRLRNFRSPSSVSSRNPSKSPKRSKMRPAIFPVKAWRSSCGCFGLPSRLARAESHLDCLRTPSHGLRFGPDNGGTRDASGFVGESPLQSSAVPKDLVPRARATVSSPLPGW
jgi:hypothetical protein